MWMVGVVVAVSVATAALVMTNKLVYGPTGQVREYFHALRTGNGSYARGLLGAQIPEGDASLLDGDALRRSVSSLGEVSYEVVEPARMVSMRRCVLHILWGGGSQQHTDFRLPFGHALGLLINGLLMRRLCRR